MITIITIIIIMIIITIILIIVISIVCSSGAFRLLRGLLLRGGRGGCPQLLLEGR